MNVPAPLIALVLKLPHRPRSAVITKSSALPAARGVLRSSSSGCDDGSTRVARLFSTRSISLANGRACWMRSCARRSRDAATIFIALVICWVDLTARIRRRISSNEGMRQFVPPVRAGSAAPARCLGRRLLRCREVLPELLQRLIQILLDRIVDLLFVGE